MLISFALFLCVIVGLSFGLADPITLTIPNRPSHNNVVLPNFLGISFELSFIDQYFGNDTTTIPLPMINYLSNLRSNVGENPFRMRIGGNSLDSSTYAANETSTTLQPIVNPNANVNDQSVVYGPMLWDVLANVSAIIQGASYLVGLPMRNPNDTTIPIIAGSAQKTLGNALDAFLLGNEPDLYTSHGDRPGIANYTTSIYMDEFGGILSHINNTYHNIGGPTICCSWNLDALIKEGYTSRFADNLKYITVQHYPQNNCFGSVQYGASYYAQHANVVSLAAWQAPGVRDVDLNENPGHPQMVMSEFNSASCGGIPNISNTFGVGSLWTVDYALQLASVGYSAAFIHTRERGIPYNTFTPPPGPNGAPGSWTTNPPYYALMATAEALQSANGSVVVDLNVQGSQQNLNSTVSGYVIYDASDSTVLQLVFFNYANVSASENSTTAFNIPATALNPSAEVSLTIRYLTALSMAEGFQIAWGGQTFAGAGNGLPVPSMSQWALQDVKMDCSGNCVVDVPAPGMAVVFVEEAAQPVPTTSATQNSIGPAAPTHTADAARSSYFERHYALLMAILGVLQVAWLL